MALNDDYLGCKSYEGQEADENNNGFTLFQDDKSGKYFFAYLGGADKVLLRSEGYADTSSRTKGIESVKKNITNAKRLAVVEDGGKYFIILKAGNHKEIGRSCDFKTQAAAEKALGGYSLSAKPAAKATSKKAAEATSTVKAEKKTVKTDTKAVAESKKAVAPKKKKATSVKDEEVKAVVSDSLLSSLANFLEVHEYLDKPRIWDSYGITGYVKFQDESGKHYFGVYNPDATLYLRSEGFNSEEDRDSAFDLMDSAILLEENYKIENLNGRYYAVLFEEGEVLAISPDFSSFIEAFVTTPGGRPQEITGTMF